MGARRNARHVRPRQQPLHRARRRGVDGTVVQLTDIAVRASTTRPTDSQRVAREEEQKLLDWVEQEAARRKRREARDRARALPKFELAERQTIADAALSADEAYRVSRRQIAPKRAPRKCRASSASRPTPKRFQPDQGRRRAGSPAAGDPQSRDRRGPCGPASRASTIPSRFRSRSRATRS